MNIRFYSAYSSLSRQFNILSFLRPANWFVYHTEARVRRNGTFNGRSGASEVDPRILSKGIAEAYRCMLGVPGFPVHCYLKLLVFYFLDGRTRTDDEAKALDR
ncbi:uncharacterized protein FOMMEDRAFT_137103 [Fomitiporia mediterranea MF3/22]|uniref:uncharacterized protein n=1 Tax=Fomitiporia mediterranea (strain MF3/22) TaxID=694068 RepID=UPI000440974F|nr:uncharacterized protein FOMMEDRAFT_137103 [Fomitiporia mediterranea MF3/22]EJC98518.1 hypothetical protein FOMMEDRAFT_137103 [Fomitiporia mediterranea MF3/22]